MNRAGNDLEKPLWEAANQLWVNTKLKPSEYSAPVLGLIFLRFAEQKFAAAEARIAKGSTGRRKIGTVDYQAEGVVFLPPEARFGHLLKLPEGANLGKAINDAMKAIEVENEDLKGVLPRTYTTFENRTLVELLKLMSSIPPDIDGDAFGKIYEYFLGNFAVSEGQKGGEFFTPTALVRLIVEVIEPFHGAIYDPACGSGGMFVQSARFVENHRKNPNAEIMVHGQEKTAETVKLCKMNLAVHGLSGDIREVTSSFYEDLHDSPGKFDFVMANPPFNQKGVNKDRLKDDRARFPLGMPSADSANYLWIQLFFSSLNAKGRAGFVMANSATDARGSEQEIRRKLIEDQAVDVVISIGPNFFYTVTLPCTLWFFDRGKKKTPRKDQVLFLDARSVFQQVDRAHRDFSTEQIEFLANIVRLYRGEEPEFLVPESKAPLKEKFPRLKYADIQGLCKVAAVTEIEKQAWSLNPGRYVGVTDRPAEDFDFAERLEELNEELERLNAESLELQSQLSFNLSGLIDRRP
jgi:type I restriction enzyme M protein